MKITKGGEYLKPDTIEKGSVITFLDEGTIEVSDKYRYKNQDGTEGEFRRSLVFLVKYKGEDKKFRMNTASRIACHDAWGNESKNWIGKQSTVHVLPTPNGSNKMIVLDPVVSKDAPKPINAEDIDWKD